MEDRTKKIHVRNKKGEEYFVELTIPKNVPEWAYVCKWIDKNLEDIVAWE